MSYAIITLGGKQYRVQEGERLLVDRVKTDAGKTFEPKVLLVGGNGAPDLTPSTTVTVRVLDHVLGEKIRIGKYKQRVGYKKHNGYRSRLSQIQVESIGGAAKKAAAKPKAEAAPKQDAPAPKAEAAPVEAAPVEAAPVEAAAPVRTAHPPKDYDTLTVAQISEQASTWRRPNLEAALEHEQANAKRKGAIAALESALKDKESH
jgi:large subunit ribosomal protein L21